MYQFMSERRSFNLGHINTVHPTFIEDLSRKRGWKAISSTYSDRVSTIIWEAPHGIFVEEFIREYNKHDYKPTQTRRVRLLDGVDLEEITSRFKSELPLTSQSNQV